MFYRHFFHNVSLWEKSCLGGGASSVHGLATIKKLASEPGTPQGDLGQQSSLQRKVWSSQQH